MKPDQVAFLRLVDWQPDNDSPYLVAARREAPVWRLPGLVVPAERAGYAARKLLDDKKLPAVYYARSDTITSGVFVEDADDPWLDAQLQLRYILCRWAPADIYATHPLRGTGDAPCGRFYDRYGAPLPGASTWVAGFWHTRGAPRHFKVWAPPQFGDDIEVDMWDFDLIGHEHDPRAVRDQGYWNSIFTDHDLSETL